MPEPAGTELAFGREKLTRRKRAKLERTGAQGASAGLSRGDGWRRSALDEQLLDFVGRFGAITTRHAATWFYDGSYYRARQRITFMVEAGLLTRSENLRWAGTLVHCTAAGLAAVHTSGSPELRPVAPRDERMLHRLLVAESAARHERHQGLRVISERESRTLERALDDGVQARAYAQRQGVIAATDPRVRGSADASGRVRWWAIPVGAGQELHWPDYSAVVAGRLIPVEIEVTLKPRARLMQVLFAYRGAINAGHISQVLWKVTADVQMELEGHRGSDGRWVGGLLQDLELLPSGRAPDWTVRGLPMVVQPVRPADEGVAFALSQRVLPATFRSSQQQWRQWRALWESSGERTDFEAWLMLRPGLLRR